MNSKPKVLYYFLMVIASIFWGLSWPIGKVLVTIAPTFTIGFFRFFFASFCLFPILIWDKSTSWNYSKKTIIYFLMLGLTGVFGYGVFFFIGIKFTTAAQGAIIAGVNPVSVSFFAHLFFKERLERKWQYLGFGVSFLGIIFVIGVQSLLDFRLDYLIGNLLILMAMGCWGLYTSISKKTMQTHSPFEVTAGGVFFGMVLFGVGAVAEEFWLLPGVTSWNFWLGVITLGVFVTVISFSFYFLSVDSIGPTKSAIFINLVPIFGTLFSAIFLQEEIYWTFLVGLFLVIIGIFIINLPKPEIQSTSK